MFGNSSTGRTMGLQDELKKHLAALPVNALGERPPSAGKRPPSAGKRPPSAGKQQRRQRTMSQVRKACPEDKALTKAIERLFLTEDDLRYDMPLSMMLRSSICQRLEVRLRRPHAACARARAAHGSGVARSAAAA